MKFSNKTKTYKNEINDIDITYIKKVKENQSETEEFKTKVKILSDNNSNESTYMQSINSNKSYNQTKNNDVFHGKSTELQSKSSKYKKEHDKTENKENQSSDLPYFNVNEVTSQKAKKEIKILSSEELKFKIEQLNQSIETKKKKRESLISNSLSHLKQSGYAIPFDKKDDSKAKLKLISLIRQPYHKEVKSLKLFEEKSKVSVSGKKEESLKNYNILKKRRFSKSQEKTYNSEIELEDYVDSKSLFFKIYLDDDIGITENVQLEMAESVADEDIESSDDLITNSTCKVRQDLYDCLHIIKNSGIEFNMRNKTKFKYNL